MGKRRTREELEKQVQDLGAYQEAFWAMQAGEKPEKITSGPHVAWLLGKGRSCGGVVWLNDSATVHYAERWAGEVSRSVDPYVAELGRKVFRAVCDAIKARVWRDSPVRPCP